MHVLLVALGSHGDVHPFVGIGLGLRARGRYVSVIANPHFRSLIERVGLGFIPVGTSQEYHELASNPALWRRFGGTRIVLGSLHKTLRPVFEAIASRYVAGRTAVAASSLALGARVAEDQLGIPTATVHLQPSVFLSAIDPPRLQGTFMPRWMPLWMRRAQIAMINRVADPIIAPPLNAFRNELGLPPVRHILTNYMHSPQRVIGLFPEWYAPPAADWPPQARLTGFPLFDERDTERLDADLQRFLDAGDPPIAFTPGSAMWTGERFFAAATGACERLGRRGLLLSRHAEHIPRSLPAGVRHVPYAPFSELLPRCAALVHHGGIGTGAQALAAGVPQLIVPHAHDQPDNAARLVALGVAKQLEPRRFRAGAVARILEELLSSSAVAGACAIAAARFAGVDPIRETCDLIEALAPPAPLTPAPAQVNDLRR